MWIERNNRKNQLLQAINGLSRQVLFVRGARQVGKTSFIVRTLQEFKNEELLFINLSSNRQSRLDGVSYYGRDFFGAEEDGSTLLHNISLLRGKKEKPLIVFIDEADRHPPSLEAVQNFAGLSDKIKFIYTGSNLENVAVKNAATGRKQYFDLYPITFSEFLKAYDKEEELRYLEQFSLSDLAPSDYFHHNLNQLFDLFLRLGGMPKILDTFIDKKNTSQTLPHLVSDLVTSIEENVKIVLGEKSKLYEYEDVLKRLALSSTDTLKFSRLQVQHAGRLEAKRLVNKTVGARVAHKIRLFDSEKDLSKYILFDSGILNFLLNGSDLVSQKITESRLAIQYESLIGNEIIASLPTRDDLYYWKSTRGAQVEFVLQSPLYAAIDVKSKQGNLKSLNSAALFEEDLDVIVKISKEQPRLYKNHSATNPNQKGKRSIPLLVLPHYLGGRLQGLLREV